MSDKRLGVGIIGLGIGKRHLETVNASRVAYVAGICDLDSIKLTQVGRMVPNAFQTKNSSELINDPRVDVVVIASYDSAHGGQVIEALTARKHVFVEKPLCTSRIELDLIQNHLAENPRLAISSNLVLRTRGKYRVLRRLIDCGFLGNLYYLEADYDYGRIHKFTHGWRGEDPQYSVMLGGGIHMVDLVIWLVGKPLLEVVAMGSNSATRGQTLNGADDTQVALLKFETGVLAKVSANFPIALDHSHSLKVCGTSATFLESPEEPMIVSRQDNEEGFRSKRLRGTDGPKSAVFASFLHSIRDGSLPLVPQKDALASAEAAIRIIESLANKVDGG